MSNYYSSREILTHKKYKVMKSTLKLGLLLIGGICAYHHPASAQQMEYGVKVGATYNFQNYGNQNVSDKESKIGAQAGVFMRLGSDVYFQPEVMFSLFKTAYKIDGKSYDPTFYQLSVPLQIGYKFFQNDQMLFRGSIGPQANYNLKSNNAFGNSEYKDLSFDGLVNVGVDIDQFIIDLRYNHGFSKTSKELDSKNNVLGLSIGYKF